jgi:hypothetical protein
MLQLKSGISSRTYREINKYDPSVALGDWEVKNGWATIENSNGPVKISGFWGLHVY